MKFASVGGEVFHALFRDCLAQQRSPTEAEIKIVACKIWQDGFAYDANRGWRDLQPGSADYDRSIRAARMAFGIRPFDAPQP